jgi:hypothetical protein
VDRRGVRTWVVELVGGVRVGRDVRAARSSVIAWGLIEHWERRRGIDEVRRDVVWRRDLVGSDGGGRVVRWGITHVGACKWCILILCRRRRGGIRPRLIWRVSQRSVWSSDAGLYASSSQQRPPLCPSGPHPPTSAPHTTSSPPARMTPTTTHLDRHPSAPSHTPRVPSDHY